MTESYHHHNHQEPSSSSSQVAVSNGGHHPSHQSSGQVVSVELSTSQQLQYKFAAAQHQFSCPPLSQTVYQPSPDVASSAMTNGSSITANYGYDSPDCGYYENEPVDHHNQQQQYRSTCAMQHLQQMTQSPSNGGLADFPTPIFVQHHMGGGQQHQQQQQHHYPVSSALAAAVAVATTDVDPQHSDSIGKLLLPHSRNPSPRGSLLNYFSRLLSWRGVLCLLLSLSSANKRKNGRF